MSSEHTPPATAAPATAAARRTPLTAPTSVRIIGFLALLLAVFVASFAIGRVVGPVGAPPSTVHGHSMEHTRSPAGRDTSTTPMPGGAPGASTGTSGR